MIPKREKGEDRPSMGGTGSEPKGRHGDFRGLAPQERRARGLGRAEMKKRGRWLMSAFGIWRQTGTADDGTSDVVTRRHKWCCVCLSEVTGVLNDTLTGTAE